MRTIVTVSSLILLAILATTSVAWAKPVAPDKDMQAVLNAHASLKPKPIETLSAEEARKQPSVADGVNIVMQQKGLNPRDTMGVSTKDITIKGAAGDLPARIYMPETASKKPLPVILYFHGGGWVIADIDTYDATPRAIAKGTHAIVISAHYRQAPEHKFPAAHDDAFAIYQWVVANANTLGGSSRIAVMGESAGANLALYVSMKARDDKIVAPWHQVLVYPVAGVDMNTPSYQIHANAKPLNKPMMEWFVDKVISSKETLQDPRLDVVGQADLSKLPATTIVLADIDPLRSEGKLLANKMKEAGVDVEENTYNGVTHEFFGMAAVVDKAKEAQEFVIGRLKTALAE
jgi:acetyl esterase